MKSPLRQCQLLVKKSPIHGYGVFADQDIEEDDIIEECHTLVFPQSIPALSNYAFKGVNTQNGMLSLLPLGYACIYNHSDKPNAYFDFDSNTTLLVFRSLRLIRCGEEICTFYGDNWFDSRRIKQSNLSLARKLRKHLPSMLFLARFAIVCTALFVLIKFSHA